MQENIKTIMQKGHSKFNYYIKIIYASYQLLSSPVPNTRCMTVWTLYTLIHACMIAWLLDFALCVCIVICHWEKLMVYTYIHAVSMMWYLLQYTCYIYSKCWVHVTLVSISKIHAHRHNSIHSHKPERFTIASDTSVTFGYLHQWQYIAPLNSS